MRRVRLLISSIAGGPPFTRSISSSSLASVSVAPFAPIVSDLAAGRELVDAVERLRVDGGVAVDERVLELLLHRLRLAGG